MTSLVHRHYDEIFGRAAAKASYPLGDIIVDVLTFRDTPCKGASTFATAGIASVLGQELLFACYSRHATPDTPKLVGAVAKQLIESREGVRRGQVLGPAGKIQPNATVEAFYICAPTYFPEHLEPLFLPTGQHVHFFWIVPIHRSEASWVEKHDTDEYLFEDILEHQDPDVLDLRRAAVELS